MIKYANNLSAYSLRSGLFKPKHKMSLDEAVMFVTFYEEDGIKGWRLPTEQESINNGELTGCWHQGDLSSSWPPDEYYFVRPVKDID